MTEAGGSELLRQHGGRIDAAARLYPQAPTPWLDLSTGISPHAYPLPPVAPEVWRRLPLGRDLAALEAAAAGAYGCPAGMVLVPVPGSEIAIRLLPWLVPARSRVGLLGPTYPSHAAAWSGSGAVVRSLAGLPPPDADDLDVVVLANPNNPDGRVVARADLLAFAERWGAAGRRLVVDEAFADVAPEVSLLALPALPPGVVVLRSLGKFFGLAGLRVGVVAVAEANAPAWRQRLGDWPVAGPACVIATAALTDAGWIAAMRARLAADRRRLDALLAAGGIAPCGGTDLFVLAEGPAGIDLVDHFARAGILVRGFAGAPGRIRVGLPGAEAEWSRLAAAIDLIPRRCAAAAR